MAQQLYRLSRKSTLTGATGYGSTHMTGEEVDKWVREMNAQYLMISHWAEPVSHTK